MTDPARQEANRSVQAANPSSNVAVIAIGAAWSQREGVRRLLDALPANLDAACLVFDTDELDAGPLTPESLGRPGVAWAEDGMRLRPGAVLVAPAAAAVAFEAGRLLVDPGGGPHALDAFAISLAHTPLPAVLVILAAPRYGGTLGAAALSARGGLVIASAEGSVAQTASNLPGSTMPVAAIPSEIVAHLRRSSPMARLAPPARYQGFGEAAELDQLVADLPAELVRGRPAGGKFRAWVLGCGTGEAVYSLAMALRERLEPSGLSLQVFATDIDSQALALARTGRYLDPATQLVAPERLEHWFVRKGPALIVRPELRELCIFAGHNILRDPAFSRIDLVCCRTPLGQLPPAPQEHVLRTLHFAVSPGGLLWLGADEALPGELFQATEGRPRLYRRATVPKPTAFAPRATPSGHSLPALARWRQAGIAAVTAEAERVAASHGPSFVVVNAELAVLHFSARMGRYLAPSAGEASLSLLQLVHGDIRPSLTALLQRVAQTGEPAQTGRLSVELESGRVGVTVQAEPLPGAGTDKRHMVVLFQDGAKPGGGEAAASRDAGRALDAAQDELETTREELRSLSEEFRLVSGELAHHAADLVRANSDMRNVLESTRIAIIFLDDALQVQSFTPAATELVPLAASDIGRPISHFALRVDYPGLGEDAAHVLRSLATMEREVSAAQGDRRYIVRMLPYRRIDNFIAGVVVTFLDITAAFEAERAMRNSEDRFRLMAEVVPAFLFIADRDGAWQYANPPFYAYTGLTLSSPLGDGWWQAVQGEDVADCRRAWQDGIEQRSEIEVECRLRRADGADSWFLLRAVPRLDQQGDVAAWFGSCTDIDARRRAGRRQRQLLAELQHRVTNILAVVRSVVVRTVETSKSVDDLSAHLSGRIGTIARIQAVIARNPGDAVMLSELIDQEFAAHGGQVDRQTELAGPPVVLADKAAESLGLALHELTTNAIKYGALSVPSGRLSVRWQLYPMGLSDPPQQRLVLEWLESGVPVTDLQPSRWGFGRELLESGLPDELGASTALEFRPGGVRWVIQLTVTESAPAAALASAAQ